MNRLFKTLLLALLIPVCTLLTMHLRIQGYRLGQGLRPQLINFVRSERTALSTSALFFLIILEED